MPPEDGWPNIMNSYRNSRSVFSGPGRLFLCLMIIVTPDGVSEAKATNTKAEHCNKSFNRQHKRRPPFQYFRSKTDYVNGGSQSLGEGQPSTILVTPNIILSQLPGVFNKIRHRGIDGKLFYSASHINLTEQKERPENPYFTGFPV